MTMVWMQVTAGMTLKTRVSLLSHTLLLVLKPTFISMDRARAIHHFVISNLAVPPHNLS